jgi:hypothetical protein
MSLNSERRHSLRGEEKERGFTPLLVDSTRTDRSSTASLIRVNSARNPKKPSVLFRFVPTKAMSDCLEWMKPTEERKTSSEIEFRHANETFDPSKVTNSRETEQKSQESRLTGLEVEEAESR